jgi:hypothetical protein
MPIHFEELWEQCEQLHKEGSSSGDDQVPALIDEIMMKLNLYRVIENNKEIAEEERQKVKSRTYGEILLALTNLSFIDNINVFEALSVAMKYRSVKHFSQKYET